MALHEQVDALPEPDVLPIRAPTENSKEQAMPLVRPRLTDFHDLPIAQEAVDFAVPFLDEDIPLCLDPFLLWKSPSLQDNALHTALVNSFNHLGYLVHHNKQEQAKHILIRASECQEVGLGFSATRQGHKIGKKTAEEILSLFENVPQLRSSGFVHFEEIQLLVDNISKDRVSDIACNYLMSFLIDFTIHQCDANAIPMQDTTIPALYDYRKNDFTENEKVKLPVNPQTGHPVLLVPKRWLRAIPWISFDDYIQTYYLKEICKNGEAERNRVAILNYNRHNYDVVRSYTQSKERVQSDCKNDPLFKQLPVFSVTRKVARLKKLPTGMKDNNDQEYEDIICQMLPSMLYPHLDFAEAQSRTDSGVLIRDLIFYNTRSQPLLKDIFQAYESRQLVFEIKNVKEIERDHINQLNRYLNDQFGRFGVLVTRNPLSKAMFRNTIDLWAGQRRCIIALTDEDIALMGQVFQNKQRLPIEVLNRAFVEFVRACPS